jgi:hypothetical protein
MMRFIVAPVAAAHSDFRPGRCAAFSPARA